MRKYQIRYTYPTSAVLFPKLTDPEVVASLVNRDLELFENTLNSSIVTPRNVTFSRLSKESIEKNNYSRVTIATLGQHYHIPMAVEVLVYEEPE